MTSSLVRLMRSFELPALRIAGRWVLKDDEALLSAGLVGVGEAGNEGSAGDEGA